jgi:hypothetical protein
MPLTEAQFRLLVTAARSDGMILMGRGAAHTGHRKLIDHLVLEGLLTSPEFDASCGALKWTITDIGRAALREPHNGSHRNGAGPT